MTTATPEQQQRLLALQQIDSQIRRLQQRRANLPEQQALDENAETLRAVAAEYADTQDALEDQRSIQRKREQDISHLEARRKAEEARLYSGELSTEKQVDAQRAELSSLRQRKSAYEDELLAAMEQIEELEGRVEQLTSRHQELRTKAGELTEARDAAAGDIDAELAERRTERERLAGDVEPPLLTLYEEVRTAQGGTAVAPLEEGTCQGCFLEISVIELEQIKAEAKHGLPRCPHCDRLLVLAAR